MPSKKCKICNTEFEPFNSLQKVCGVKCAVKLTIKTNEAKAVKAERKDTRKRKQALKSKSDWLKEAQAVFNKYVRLRDAREPCISCGNHHNGQYHAGHYLSVGAHPELRFHPYNNNKQCAPCNNHLSGNQIKYRARLSNKIGNGNVEWLEGKQEIQHLSIDDIKDIKQYYKEQTKILTKER